MCTGDQGVEVKSLMDQNWRQGLPIKVVVGYVEEGVFYPPAV